MIEAGLKGEFAVLRIGIFSAAYRRRHGATTNARHSFCDRSRREGLRCGPLSGTVQGTAFFSAFVKVNTDFRECDMACGDVLSV